MIFLVDTFRHRPNKIDLAPSVKPEEMVRKKPVYLDSGRMACVPAWEQDLMEQREKWLEKQGTNSARFEARTNAIIAEVLSRSKA